MFSNVGEFDAGVLVKGLKPQMPFGESELALEPIELRQVHVVLFGFAHEVLFKILDYAVEHALFQGTPCGTLNDSRDGLKHTYQFCFALPQSFLSRGFLKKLRLKLDIKGVVHLVRGSGLAVHHDLHSHIVVGRKRTSIRNLDAVLNTEDWKPRYLTRSQTAYRCVAGDGEH